MCWVAWVGDSCYDETGTLDACGCRCPSGLVVT